MLFFIMGQSYLGYKEINLGVELTMPIRLLPNNNFERVSVKSITHRQHCSCSETTTNPCF